jgi:VIT1/CCC1 family predicted Fe2+/Mn2+ transporter
MSCVLPIEDQYDRSSKDVLEPQERVSEVLFGLIMVLTFTGSLSIAEANDGDVRTMLIGALGCNLAWGIIDGIFFLMGCLSEQAKGMRAWRAARNAPDPEAAHRAIASELPSVLAATLGPADFESLRQKLIRLPEPPSRSRLGRKAWLGAFAVFLWVFLVTFPVAVPFIFMDDVGRAIRVSNAIAIGLLFLSGYAFGKIADYRPWLTGLAMVAVGSALVSIAIALGG